MWRLAAVCWCGMGIQSKWYWKREGTKWDYLALFRLDIKPDLIVCPFDLLCGPMPTTDEAVDEWADEFNQCPAETRREIADCFSDAGPTHSTAPSNTSTSPRDDEEKDYEIPWKAIMLWVGVGAVVLVVMGVVAGLLYYHHERLLSLCRRAEA